MKTCKMGATVASIFIAAFLCGCAKTNSDSTSPASQATSDSSASSQPKENELEINSNGDGRLFTITARANSVKITNIVVNRGNCVVAALIDHAYVDPKYPIQLAFGDQYKISPRLTRKVYTQHDVDTATNAVGPPGIYFGDSCNTIELSVETNQGKYTQTFTP